MSFGGSPEEGTFYLKNYEDIFEYKNVIKTRFDLIKIRSVKNNMNFDLSIDFLLELWILQRGKCFYTKREMSLFGYMYGFSVDRIDSSKGYESDNIVLCCNCINIMKCGHSQERFIEICRLVSDNFPIKN